MELDVTEWRKRSIRYNIVSYRTVACTRQNALQRFSGANARQSRQQLRAA